jgi:hypothetical protein
MIAARNNCQVITELPFSRGLKPLLPWVADGGKESSFPPARTASKPPRKDNVTGKVRFTSAKLLNKGRRKDQ